MCVYVYLINKGGTTFIAIDERYDNIITDN